MSKLLVTGALGFIGSNFVNYMASKYTDMFFVILDKKAYCSSLDHINKNISDRVEIVIGDIQNTELVGYLMRKFKIEYVVHFAAESHVDNSFFHSLSFTSNNVLGTHCLLETSRKYHEETSALKKFIHVSTDEVYGDVNNGIERCEKSTLDPTNPYAASKAAAEAFVKAYYHSYKLPIVITRGNNVYGKQQYPEKLISKFICLLLDGKKLTIQGTGECKRSFIHIDDVVKAFECVLNHGVIGEIYNIGSNIQEFSVMEVAKILLEMFGYSDDYIEYIEDRKFNDTRYLIDNKKLIELGWKMEKLDFKENLRELIDWYRENREIYNKN